MQFNIGRWKFTLEFIWPICKPSWLYTWKFYFCPFLLSFFDLAGILVIMNLTLKWEKLLKSHG